MSGVRQKNKRAERRARIVAFGGGEGWNWQQGRRRRVLMKEEDRKEESPDYIPM